MTDVAGRAAFITGGANGIGLGIARALAADGAKLALVDVDAEALERAKEELGQSTRVEIARLDVCDRDAYARVADDMEARLGPVSLLFNNAGVSGGGPAGKLTYSAWDWSLGVNLGGVINGLQVFLARMLERRNGGHIVNTASGAGLAATNSGVLYHTAKFAVVGLSEALRQELDPLGVGVTVLCPGPVATKILDNAERDSPLASLDLTPEQKIFADERKSKLSALLQQGASPDAVGHMVIDAIKQNRLYVHTDRFMAPIVEARTKMILDAMPSGN